MPDEYMKNVHAKQSLRELEVEINKSYLLDSITIYLPVGLTLFGMAISSRFLGTGPTVVAFGTGFKTLGSTFSANAVIISMLVGIKTRSDLETEISRRKSILKTDIFNNNIDNQVIDFDRQLNEISRGFEEFGNKMFNPPLDVYERAWSSSLEQDGFEGINTDKDTDGESAGDTFDSNNYNMGIDYDFDLENR